MRISLFCKKSFSYKSSSIAALAVKTLLAKQWYAHAAMPWGSCGASCACLSRKCVNHRTVKGGLPRVPNSSVSSPRLIRLYDMWMKLFSDSLIRHDIKHFGTASDRVLPRVFFFPTHADAAQTRADSGQIGSYRPNIGVFQLEKGNRPVREIKKKKLKTENTSGFDTLSPSSPA